MIPNNSVVRYVIGLVRKESKDRHHVTPVQREVVCIKKVTKIYTTSAECSRAIYKLQLPAPAADPTKFELLQWEPVAYVPGTNEYGILHGLFDQKKIVRGWVYKGIDSEEPMQSFHPTLLHWPNGEVTFS